MLNGRHLWISMAFPAAAIAIQFVLLRLDFKADTQNNARLQTLRVQSGYELRLDNAAGEPLETLLSYHADDRHNHRVTLQMERASLAPQSAALLGQSGVPANPGKLLYAPDSQDRQAKTGKPCWTAMRVDFQDSGAPAARSVIIRAAAPGEFKQLDRLRTVHLRSASPLVVRISANSQDGQSGPNCRNLLSIDQWQHALGKDWEFAFVAAPDSDVLLKITADPALEDGFHSGEAELESLELQPLHPVRLAVFPSDANRVSEVRKRAGKPIMTVTNLRLGGDFLDIELSGMLGLPVSQFLGIWRWPLLAVINGALLLLCLRRPSDAFQKVHQSLPPLPPSEHLHIFFSYSWADRDRVMPVHDLLNAAGAECWIDREGIRAGDDWKLAIEEQMRNSDLVFVFLSQTSVQKKGYWWVEIDMASNIAREQPEGRRFVVPIRLEDCPLPHALGKWDCLDWYKPDGPQRLLRALNLTAKKASA